MKMNKISPIVRQYLALKREASHDSILLLRVWEFYGIFGKENIDEVRDILSIPDSLQDKVFMPIRDIDTILAKFIRNGKTVALADYADNTRRGVLTRREITRIISPYG